MIAACSHPDHSDRIRCVDRAVACDTDCACCRDEPLLDVVAAVFGGVGAISPSRLKSAVADIAKQCGCPLDESLYAAVGVILANDKANRVAASDFPIQDRLIRHSG